MSGLFESLTGAGRTASPALRVPRGVPQRTATVVRVETLTPALRRVVFGGPEMAGFSSASPDDHVKLFFDLPDGTVAARDYTPRRFDAARGELAIDFVLHGHDGGAAGPASDWAAQAAPGQRLTIGGPRGSRAVPPADAWLLVGDETAIPSIARRLEEIAPGTPVTAVIEVADAAGELALHSDAALQLLWRHRRGVAAGQADVLDRAIESLELPGGALRVWMAGEIGVVRRLRTHLLAERGLPRNTIQAAGYWRVGEADSHQRLED